MSDNKTINLYLEALNPSLLSNDELKSLGNVSEIPDETKVNEYKLTELSETFIEFEDDKSTLEVKLYQIAKELINNNNLEEAWMTLLSFND